MGIEPIFDAHNLGVGAISFLVVGFLCVRLHGRQFSERVHPPDAAGNEHRHAAVALSALPVLHPVVSQRPAGDVAGAARPVQKLRRADFAALLHRRTADGCDVFGLLAGFRQQCHRSLAIIYAIFLAGLIAATFIDFEHFIIPDEITYGGMAVGLVASFCFRRCTVVTR